MYGGGVRDLPHILALTPRSAVALAELGTLQQSYARGAERGMTPAAVDAALGGAAPPLTAQQQSLIASDLAKH